MRISEGAISLGKERELITYEIKNSIEWYYLVNDSKIPNAQSTTINPKSIITSKGHRIEFKFGENSVTGKTRAGFDGW